MAGKRQRFRRSARRLITHFGETVKIYRRTPGRRVNRRWVPGTVEVSTVTAAVNPAQRARESGEARDIAPEGARESSVLRFFLAAKDLSALRSGETQADEIEYKDVRYRVYSVEDFSVFGHIEVVALGPDR